LLLSAPDSYSQTRKFGIILGNNLGHDASRELRYAEQDARKMYRVLLELGDFQPENLQLLLAADSEQAWKTLRETERRIHEASGRTLLLLYYSGHAEGDVLELGKSSVKFGELSSFLKSSAADVRLAFIDSCKSGRLVAAKGGTRGPAFAIRVTEEIASKGYAIITSSAEDELSHESREIRGSFFTHYLVSALRGAGEGYSDGKVTLQEAYRYAYSRTVARTSTTISGSQHPMYDFQLSGKGEIVLTRTGDNSAFLSVLRPDASRLVVLDEDETGVVAECEVPASRRMVLALSPGIYNVFLIADENVSKANVSLSKGKETRLAAEDFKSQTLVNAVSKGGMFRRLWTQQIQGGMVLRRMPLEGTALSYGAGLSYRLQSPRGGSIVARFVWTSAPDAGNSMGYFDLGAYAGAGYAWVLGGFVARAEILAGYEHLFQDDYLGKSRNSSGLGYLALLAADVEFGAMVISLEGGVGGRIFKLREGGLVHRLDLQISLGFGWKWGG
jgi:hypothetical protein